MRNPESSDPIIDRMHGIMPLAPRQYGTGHVVDTDYGWRYFPGAASVRKDMAMVRGLGWNAKRMACGTYRLTMVGVA